MEWQQRGEGEEGRGKLQSTAAASADDEMRQQAAISITRAFSSPIACESTCLLAPLCICLLSLQSAKVAAATPSMRTNRFAPRSLLSYDSSMADGKKMLVR